MKNTFNNILEQVLPAVPRRNFLAKLGHCSPTYSQRWLLSTISGQHACGMHIRKRYSEGRSGPWPKASSRSSIIWSSSASASKQFDLLEALLNCRRKEAMPLLAHHRRPWHMGLLWRPRLNQSLPPHKGWILMIFPFQWMQCPHAKHLTRFILNGKPHQMTDWELEQRAIGLCIFFLHGIWGCGGDHLQASCKVCPPIIPSWFLYLDGCWRFSSLFAWRSVASWFAVWIHLPICREQERQREGEWFKKQKIIIET